MSTHNDKHAFTCKHAYVRVARLPASMSNACESKCAYDAVGIGLTKMAGVEYGGNCDARRNDLGNVFGFLVQES